MGRKFHHFLLFLLLNCSWTNGIRNQVNHKHYSGFAVGAGSVLTIDDIISGPCSLEVSWSCSNCDISTFDGYNITWQQVDKDKESVPSIVSYRSSYYLIENLISDASYTVWVAAVIDDEETLSDSAQKSTTKGEPAKVTGVTTGEVSDTVVNVLWEESSSVCPIQGYRVTWNGTSKWDSKETPNKYRETDKTTMEVDNLEPCSVYNFYVSEITTDGIIGEPSDPVTAETKEGTASAPEPVTSLALGPYSAQVNWTFPESPNGEILGYHVSCKILPDSTDECDILINDTDIFTTNATELKTCGNYTFSVQAINAQGFGEPGTHSSRTDPEPPPHFTNFGFVNLTSTSVVLTWDPLDTNCPVTKYIIHVEETVLWSDTTDAFDETDTSEDNHFLLEYLTPYSHYDISIRATTEGGTTTVADSDQQEIVTLEGAAGPPAYINSSTVDESSVLLFWAPSKEINGVLLNYHILCRKRGELRFDCDDTTTELTYEAKELDACGDYTFRVTAVNGAGDGDGATTKSTTDTEPPSNIKSVDVVNENSTNIAITITFEEPVTTCDILRYDIVGAGTTEWNDETQDYKDTLLVDSKGNTVVQNLIPFTNYTFNVSATTEGGISNGYIFEAKTDKDVPSEPRNLKATPVDTTSIKVTWDEPEYQNGRRLGSYYLTYGLSRSTESDAIEVKNLRQYTIGDKSHDNEELLPCRTYTITVSASNEVGNGTAASARAGLDSEVPEAVTLPRCNSISANQIELLWNVEHTSCRLTYYEIFLDGDILWGDTTNKTITVSNTPSIRGSYTLDDLIAYTSYNITLTPGNDAGLGEPKSLTCETLQTVPSAPTKLALVEVKKHSFSFVWDDPDFENGVMKQFIITLYEEAEFVEVHTVLYSDDDSRYNYSFEDLDDETPYQVLVAAENEAGIGATADLQVVTLS